MDKHFYFSNRVSTFAYEGAMKSAIYAFKYGKQAYRAKGLASLMANFLVQNSEQISIDIKKIDCIIPVPVHRLKKISRGFNQAELLAVSLGKIFDIPVYNDMVIRVKNTPPQAKVSAQERELNVHNAFAIKKVKKECKDFLIVDDIYTTGATVNEVARTLALYANAENIACFTLTATAFVTDDKTVSSSDLYV